MRALLLIIIGLAIGVGGGALNRQIQDLRGAYATVSHAFDWALTIDRSRQPPIAHLLALAAAQGRVDPIDRLQLYLAVSAIDPLPALSLMSAPVDFEIYDRHQLRVSEKLSRLTQAAYGDPAILAAPQLSVVQSAIEGTESAALMAHIAYNDSVTRYEALLRAQPQADLAALLGLPGPHRLPRFALYGEAGPANQEWQLRDAHYMRTRDDDDD